MPEAAEEQAEVPEDQQFLSLAAAPSEYNPDTADMPAPGEFDAGLEGMDAIQDEDMATPFAAEEPLLHSPTSK